MLSRAFSQVLGKGSKCPLDLFVQRSSAVVRFGSKMPRHFHHLLAQPEPAADGFPLHNSSAAPPTATCVLESDGTVKNSDDTPLDSTSGRSFEERLATLRSVGECANQYELGPLLKKKAAPVCYVWCDVTPWMHITQGILMALNVNKMIKAGCKVKILMADWFAWLDCKIGHIVQATGGDPSRMQSVGLYNAETWRAAGMDLDGVELVWLSDLMCRNAGEYWPLAMDIARRSDVGAIKRWLHLHASIHTRGHGDMNPYRLRDCNAAEIFNPCLQSACILFHKADIWLLGHEQTGADMLARRYCDRMEMKNRPIALFNDMPRNLLETPELCAVDDWAIFMEDDEEDVISKISDGFCPPESVQGNPCLDYVKYMVLPWFGKFEVVLKGDNGASKTFVDMEEFNVDYERGALDPSDVKDALAKAINMMLQPVRDHFGSSAEAKRLVEANEDFYLRHW